MTQPTAENADRCVYCESAFNNSFNHHCVKSCQSGTKLPNLATLFRYNINAAKWTKIGFQPSLQLEALIHRLVATQAVVEIDVPDQPVVSKVVIIQAVIDVPT